MTRHLHIDPFSGVAGDMFLGALVDLGVDPQSIQQTLEPLALSPAWRVTVRRVMRHGIGAVDLRVQVEGEPAPDRQGHTHDHGHGHGHGHDDHSHDHDHDQGNSHSHGHSHDHDHRHDHPADPVHHDHVHVGHGDIMAMIDRLTLPPRARDRARRVVTLLGEAEARVHQKPLDQVHFHEVGAVDSIVDLLGTVIALEQLDIDTLSCGALPLSSGFVRCAHGLMPVPAPATAYLLEGLPCVGVERRGELITPTGAALVRGLCTHFGPPPAMTMGAVGYGAGDREDPEIPNLLRVLRGERTAADAGRLTPDTAASASSTP